MNNNTASILFRPVCSKCRGLLYRTIDFIEYPAQIENYKGAILPTDFDIIPNKCPYCNASFESIEMPTKLPFYWRSI